MTNKKLDEGLGDFISSIFSKVMNKIGSSNNSATQTQQVKKASTSPSNRDRLPKKTKAPFNPYEKTVQQATKDSEEFNKQRVTADNTVSPRVPPVKGPPPTPSRSLSPSTRTITKSNTVAKTNSNTTTRKNLKPIGPTSNYATNKAPGDQHPSVSAVPDNMNAARDKVSRERSTLDVLKKKASDLANKSRTSPKPSSSETVITKTPPAVTPQGQTTTTTANPLDNKAASSRAALPSKSVSAAIDNKPKPPKQSRTTNQVKKAVQKKKETPKVKANFKGGFGQKATYRFN